jgi:hypothetical protein
MAGERLGGADKPGYRRRNKYFYPNTTFSSSKQSPVW